MSNNEIRKAKTFKEAYIIIYKGSQKNKSANEAGSECWDNGSCPCGGLTLPPAYEQCNGDIEIRMIKQK
ncbi:MAG: hypothetical protein IJ422_05735 [Oscillospiraceae bacterium]|nr:hypothetical protein [Oscillospiraceae bacterium]